MSSPTWHRPRTWEGKGGGRGGGTRRATGRATGRRRLRAGGGGGGGSWGCPLLDLPERLSLSGTSNVWAELVSDRSDCCDESNESLGLGGLVSRQLCTRTLFWRQDHRSGKAAMKLVASSPTEYSCSRVGDSSLEQARPRSFRLPGAGTSLRPSAGSRAARPAWGRCCDGRQRRRAGRVLVQGAGGRRGPPTDLSTHQPQREGRAWGGATEPPAGAVGSGGGRVCSWAALGRHSVGAAEG